MRLRFIHADLFYLNDVDTLVCPVNCMGTMGNGLALAFKLRFPSALFEGYRNLCLNRQLRPGNCWLYKQSNINVLCFATKDHWMNGSQLAWIQKGLYSCLDNLPKHNVKRIAFPLIGCGKGGLTPDSVIALFKEVFDEDLYEDLDLDITVCL